MSWRRRRRNKRMTRTNSRWVTTTRRATTFRDNTQQTQVPCQSRDLMWQVMRTKHLNMSQVSNGFGERKNVDAKCFVQCHRHRRVSHNLHQHRVVMYVMFEFRNICQTSTLEITHRYNSSSNTRTSRINIVHCWNVWSQQRPRRRQRLLHHMFAYDWVRRNVCT